MRYSASRTHLESPAHTHTHNDDSQRSICGVGSLCNSVPLQSFLVAVVVPDPEVLPGFAEKLGVSGSLEELCKKQVCVLSGV